MNNKNIFREMVPVFIQFLGNLSAVLDKSHKHLGRKLGEKKLVEGRLAPDMYNLRQQVGYAYFMTLESMSNLTGKQGPKFTYNEKNIKELRTSLSRTIKFLKTIKPKDFAVSGGKRIKTFLLNPTQKVSRDKYIHELAIPNFFFHVTTAYDILRHLGAPIGKDDYLGM